MSKVLAVLVALVAPFVAEASCVWTVNADQQSGKVVCSTVSETAIAGAAGTTVGWPANMCAKGMYFTACTDSGQAVTAAATLSVYAYNPWATLWSKWPDRNFTSETITSTQRCQTFDALWTVVAGGRIAVIPTAGTLDGGSLTIWWGCN